MGKIAFIFPGQGAQYVGMGKDFFDNYLLARQTYNEADSVLNLQISDICFNGPEEGLMLTENTQPAILATSIAMLRILQQEGFVCDYTAGLSLGEYSALVNAGSIQFSDAVKIVKNRGTYMQQAVPNGIGRMGAIIGLSAEQIEDVVDYSKKYGLIKIANYNTYGQTVLTGEKKAINAALKKARSLGARRALPLLVNTPFHCSFLEPAGKLLEKDLNKIKFITPKIPFVSNVNAEIITNKKRIIEHLVKQVSNSVLWRQSVELLINKGVRIFIEIGPGTTLNNMVKEIAAYQKIDIISESINDIEGLHKVITILENCI
jgi:[acyl-carrier-protein] S-malonyltransferase